MVCLSRAKEVVAAIQRCFDHDDIDETSSLGSVESWDSVRQLFILMEIERSFGISISDDHLVLLTSVEAIINYIENAAEGR